MSESEEKVMNRWIVVIGAVLIQLALGTIYCWGNLSTYVTAYLNAHSAETIDKADTLYIFAVGLMAFAITMIFSGQLQQKIGPMKVAMIGGALVFLGVFLSSFMTTLTGMLITYGLLFGIGIGFAYVTPIACAAKWFPDKKGLINGIAVAGFGAGAFIFNLITTGFVNPDNLSIKEGVPETVYSKVPSLFILLAIIYAVMIFGGALTLKNPPEGWKPEGWNPPAPKQDSEGKEIKTDIPREEAIKMPQLYMLIALFTLSASAGLFTIGNYKAFGLEHIDNDALLSMVGSLAALTNGLGRVVWGWVADKIGYKKAMFTMFGTQSVLMFTFYSTGTNETLFLIWVMAIYFCFGGNFSLYPTATTDAFGAKYLGPNYGVVFLGYGIAGVSGALLAGSLGSAIGFAGLFITMGVLSVLAIVLLALFKPPKEA